MPTYEYRCSSCGYDFETFQHFEDEPLQVCPECGEQLHKVFNSVGIVFKGSGFYSTDNKSSHKAAAPAKESSEPAKDSAGPAGESTSAKEPAPAKKADKKAKDSATTTSTSGGAAAK